MTESHAFFEKYGPWTIILARFAPFVRTFVPVVAGVSYMRYPVFLAFDIVGGIAWGAGATLAGYFLGNVPFVHHNLENHPGHSVHLAAAGDDSRVAYLPVTGRDKDRDKDEAALSE